MTLSTVPGGSPAAIPVSRTRRPPARRPSAASAGPRRGVRWVAPVSFALLALLALGAACDTQGDPFPVFTHDATTPQDSTGLGDAGILPDGTPGDVAILADADGGPRTDTLADAMPDAVTPLDALTDVPVSADASDASDATPPPDVAGPDLTKPQLKSAFSAKKGVVTARFSEAVGAGAADVTNFSIKGSDNQPLQVLSATPKAGGGPFVDLKVDATKLNPQLTYTLTVKGVADLAGNVIAVPDNKAKVTRTLFLNIVWHQHQPLYLDPVADQLTGPWVRKHATKDYYDMTAIAAGYPAVHFNVNLTSVMLRRLIEYYLVRMAPFIDVFENTMDVPGFMAAWKGHTDPFVDFLLEPTPTAATITEEQLLLVWKGPWTLVSTADPSMQHFPEYVALRDANRAEYGQEDFLALKIWFEIAWFDPDFLDGPVTLPDGSVTRVHQWLNKAGGKYTLNVPPSEALAVDLMIENYKIMKNVIPIHQQLFYDVETGYGQVEVTTTPMYHPILPLIYNTELMGASQPFDPRPSPAYSYPQDAEAQVLRAVRFYEDIFGVKPRGIWCGEGSVAEEIVPLLVDAGFEWTATDHDVLKASKAAGSVVRDDVHFAYQVDSDPVKGTGGDTSDAMLIVFRHTDLSDRMGFEYKTWKGVDAAQDFLDDVSALAPTLGGEDRLLTVILDGENAWEAYTQEHDGKGFHHAMYQKLTQAYETGEIVTVTTGEYIHGNPLRGIDPHPIADHTEVEPLWPGSWIGGTFSTWIGEIEENKAWEYLRIARAALAASGLPRPNPLAAEPTDKSSLSWSIWRAFDMMYAAEGSDWFWWYGVDQTTPSNDDSPFDRAFRSQLLGVYEHMNKALEGLGQQTVLVPDFAPLIQAKPKLLEGPWGGDAPPPTIDGALLPNETEWTPPGGFFFDSDSSTAISSTDDITTVYYGYDTQAFYVGLQMSEVLHPKLGSDYAVNLLVDHKHILDAALGTSQSDPANPFAPPGEDFVGLNVARRVRVDFSGAEAVMRLQKADGAGGWTDVPGHGGTLGGPLFGAMVLEIRIPFEDLALVPEVDPLSFYVTVEEGGEVIDHAPNLQAKRVFDDVTNLVFVTFEVDASGTVIPLSGINIYEKPVPFGAGTVYIVGEHDKLGDWVPNKVSLGDAGKNGDTTAGDMVWTGTFGFARGEVLRYKYTSGTGSNEGQWGGTEEFPFTNRQYLVPTDPAISTVLIRDVFGDDPPQENAMGKLSLVTENP